MIEGSISSLFVSFAQMLQSYKERHRKIMLGVCKAAEIMHSFLQREILQTDTLSVAAPSLPPSSSSGLGKKIARAKAGTLMTQNKKGSINEGLRWGGNQPNIQKQLLTTSDRRSMLSQTLSNNCPGRWL